jgi:hypothetical protein
MVLLDWVGYLYANYLEEPQTKKSFVDELENISSGNEVPLVCTYFLGSKE